MPKVEKKKKKREQRTTPTGIEGGAPEKKNGEGFRQTSKIRDGGDPGNTTAKTL